MRAGVSYSDWRQMTQWQRTSLFLSVQRRNLVFAQKLRDSDGLGDAAAVILSRLLGLD